MNTDQESAMRFNTLLERLQMSIFSLADSFVNQNPSQIQLFRLNATLLKLTVPIQLNQVTKSNIRMLEKY